MIRARDGSRARSRRKLGRSALALGALGLGVASDAAPHRELAPCRASAVSARVFEGSRLFEAPGDKLELSPGRQLDCDGAAARRVLDALDQAAGSLRGLDLAAPELLARFATPLRVHLDPRLPSRQAPLAGIEVHVSRRELLVLRAGLDALGPEVWRHELLHMLAASPPEGPSEARHLWLTLEEALVSHVEHVWPARRDTAPGAGGAPGARPQSSAPARLALPAGALLASSAYDPHPLAAGLARELGRGEAAVSPGAWVRCLAAPAPGLPAAAAGSDVFQTFGARCSPAAAGELSRAIASWWVEPEAPHRAGGGARAVETRLANARKAAARAGESR